MSLSSKRVVGFFLSARKGAHYLLGTQKQRIFCVKILTVLDEKRKSKKKKISQTKNTGQIESNKSHTLFLDHRRRRRP